MSVVSGAADSGLSQRYTDTDGGLLTLIKIFLVRLPIVVASWMVMADIPTRGQWLLRGKKPIH